MSLKDNLVYHSLSFVFYCKYFPDQKIILAKMSCQGQHCVIFKNS